MSVNTNISKLEAEDQPEELLDWSELGEHSYQIERRIKLLTTIEQETFAYFQVKFDKSKGAFFHSSGDRVSMKFVIKAQAALLEVEQSLGKPEQIEPLIRKYIQGLNNPKREKARAYLSLKSRKSVRQEKDALQKIAEGLELVSTIRQEISIYLNGMSLSARSMWMDWVNEEQELSSINDSTSHASVAPVSGTDRARFVSFI